MSLINCNLSCIGERKRKREMERGGGGERKRGGGGKRERESKGDDTCLKM